MTLTRLNPTSTFTSSTVLNAVLVCSMTACGVAGGGTPTTSDGDDDTSGNEGDGTTGADTGDGGTGPEPTCMDDKPVTECDPVNEGDECESEYCHAFSTVPIDPDSACADNEGNGVLRMTGTIRNFATGEVVANVPVKMAGALPTAQDAINVQTIAETTADAMGRFDVTTTEANQQAIGIVAIAGGVDGFYLTGTGLVEPRIGTSVYPPGVRNHDAWVQEETTLTRWSNLLEGDPEIENLLPLGEKGGVIGKIRDPICGYGIAGVRIRSWLGEETFSHVRYLDEDRGGFNTVGTADHGLFVIMNPVLPEKFDAVIDTATACPGGEDSECVGVGAETCGVNDMCIQIVSDIEGTVGNAFNAIFTVAISVELP